MNPKFSHKIYRQLLLWIVFGFMAWFPFLVKSQAVDSIDWIAIISNQNLNDQQSADPTISLIDQDTTSLIIRYIEEARSYANKVNFSKAYDGYWKALGLATTIGSLEHIAQCYQGLGILYSMFKKDETAQEYFQRALSYKKELILKGVLPKHSIHGAYFDLAVHYRYLDKPNISLARAYLDSCASISNANNQIPYMVNAEQGYLLFMEGKNRQSKELLISMKEHFQINNPEYLVIYYSQLGRLYYQKGDFRSAKQYLSLAILKAREHLKHLNFLPYIYDDLASVYRELGQYDKSIWSLQISNQLNELLYSSRSPNNEFLLEIKDQFRLDQEEKSKQLQEQKIAQLEQTQKIWMLRMVVTVISVFFVAFAIVVWIRKIRRKHRLERQAIEERRVAERKKNKELIEIKNKELTNSTLQIIAKDELLDQVREELQSAIKSNETSDLRKTVNSIKINQDLSWLEFENRFNSVNQGFFDTIKSKYPKLSPYDLKICALIKLHFTGKEMARLLGISAESANTSRYRLRKKFGLEREASLEGFIEQF
ncbi:MAG: hypothetical protein JXR10_13035 [Cyclobacteriaceae bacterium]